MTAFTEAVEQEIEKRIRIRAELMKWRPHYEAWIQERIWQERYREPVLNNLKRYVGGIHKVIISDFGSGMGGLVVRLQQEGLKVFGIDYCFDYCVIAKLRGMRSSIQTQVLNAQGEFVPLKDQSLDVILCYEVIEHVFDPVALLGEIRRTVRPHGTVFIAVPNRWSLYDHHYHLWGINYLPRRFAEWLIVRLSREKGNDLTAGQQKLSEMHYYSYFSFISLCKNIGFDMYDIREDKLLRGDLQRVSHGIQWIIRLLRKGGLLRLVYSIYRCTVMDGWHFQLIPKREAELS